MLLPNRFRNFDEGGQCRHHLLVVTITFRDKCWLLRVSDIDISIRPIGEWGWATIHIPRCRRRPRVSCSEHALQSKRTGLSLAIAISIIIISFNKFTLFTTKNNNARRHSSGHTTGHATGCVLRMGRDSAHYCRTTTSPSCCRRDALDRVPLLGRSLGLLCSSSSSDSDDPGLRRRCCF